MRYLETHRSAESCLRIPLLAPNKHVYEQVRLTLRDRGVNSRHACVLPICGNIQLVLIQVLNVVIFFFLFT